MRVEGKFVDANGEKVSPPPTGIALFRIVSLTDSIGTGSICAFVPASSLSRSPLPTHVRIGANLGRVDANCTSRLSIPMVPGAGEWHPY